MERFKMKLLALLLFLFIAGCGGSGGSSGNASAQAAPPAHQIAVATASVYKSTQARYSELLVIDYPRMGSAQRVCVMEVALEDLKAGEVLWITGEVELTNELDYAVEVCRRLSWETGTGGISGEIITPEAGTNITPQVWLGETFPGQHHGLIPFSGVYVVPSDASLRYVSLVMYAGGTSYTKDGDIITVNVNWGHLSVIRLSP
jgi:hypothetical protein